MARGYNEQGAVRSGSEREARAGRVAEMHRQTRPGVAVAAGFAVAAGVTMFVPHRTGAWLPLHLFLAGSLLFAIGAVAPMLAVTWSASPATNRTAVRLQRALLGAGVIGLAVGRELVVAWAVAASGTAIAASMVLLAGLLIQVRRSAAVTRFQPAIDGYLVALALSVVGGGLGVALGSGQGSAGTRSAHLVVNLFGLVGIVIAATLPYMTATQVRSKMSGRATPRALRAANLTLAVATCSTAAGFAVERPAVVGAGLLLYVAGMVGVVVLCPWPSRRNLGWAGPRVGSLALGVVWWSAICLSMAVGAASDDQVAIRLIVALVIGGYAQILLGSVAYLAPVLRGGGHERLAAGFRLTRSWPSLVAPNVAAAGALLWLPALISAGVVAVLLDGAVRAVLLVRPATT